MPSPVLFHVCLGLVFSWAHLSCFPTLFPCCPCVMAQAPVTMSTATSESCVTVTGGGSGSAAPSGSLWDTHYTLHYDHSWHWFPTNMTVIEPFCKDQELFLHHQWLFCIVKTSFLQGSAGTWWNKSLFFPIYSENYRAPLVSFSFPYKRKPHFLEHRKVLEAELGSEMFAKKGFPLGWFPQGLCVVNPGDQGPAPPHGAAVRPRSQLPSRHISHHYPSAPQFPVPLNKAVFIYLIFGMTNKTKPSQISVDKSQ